MPGVPFSQIVVAQLGARMHYAVPTLFHRAGMLAHCYTDSYVGPGSSWCLAARTAGLIPSSCRPALVNRLLTRKSSELPAERITAFNRFGWQYARALRRSSSIAETEGIFLAYGKRFEKAVVAHGFHGADVVYVFEGAALGIMKAARSRGIHVVYEKFSAPKKMEYQLHAGESARWPGWEPPFPDESLYTRRYALEQEEWANADAILCASEFVEGGMRASGAPASKLQVVPYGVNMAHDDPARVPWKGGRPLRLLFVGGVTLRKGVQYLYQALRELSGLAITCRVVGPVSIVEPYRSRFSEVAELTGQVPRPEVRRHYAWADVFVFPAVCEGFATVLIEAMAAGLPVITTGNAGAIVDDGLDAFVVPVGDGSALAERIERLAKDPECVSYMSKNACQRARDFTWAEYQRRLIRACGKHDASCDSQSH